MKPILFNTEMVRAILDGRKTVTRRVCKIKINDGDTVDHLLAAAVEYPAKNRFGVCANFYDENGYYRGAAQPKYFPGDILYVRETWKCLLPFRKYIYKADGLYGSNSWRPSIHMPRRAARIFLRVTDVRVQRLQDMRLKDCLAEGVILTSAEIDDRIKAPVRARERFAAVWNSTIKPKNRDIYGWDANPWVWVIEFEQISKEEAEKKTK